tara:strand:- start:559 stop:834 length:276 start_codon:yes stop_codon:yes gene_type:complete
MSKFGALKAKKTASTVTKISENLTSDNLADALSGETSSTRKAREKTNRTIPFATRVSKEFDDSFRRIAFENKLKHAELMEKMLELYKKQEL